MLNYLKVTLDQEDDGTAGLFAEVYSGKFSGIGEAWFNFSEIKSFIEQLISFVETSKNPPLLKGGYWDESGNLKDALVSLRLYSFTSYRFGLEVILAEYPYTDCRDEEVSRVSVELKPEVNQLLSFAKQLENLIHSNVGEAILEC